MSGKIDDAVFEVISFHPNQRKRRLLKSNEIKVQGKTKVSFEEDGVDGIKVVLQKDSNDNLKEIKFICSCGQTKTILLDYET